MNFNNIFNLIQHIIISISNQYREYFLRQTPSFLPSLSFPSSLPPSLPPFFFPSFLPFVSVCLQNPVVYFSPRASTVLVQSQSSFFDYMFSYLSKQITPMFLFCFIIINFIFKSSFRLTEKLSRKYRAPIQPAPAHICTIPHY